MNYKVVVPPTISKAIGTFDLNRSLTIRLITVMHNDIARDYGQFRQFRTLPIPRLPARPRKRAEFASSVVYGCA